MDSKIFPLAVLLFFAARGTAKRINHSERCSLVVSFNWYTVYIDVYVVQYLVCLRFNATETPQDTLLDSWTLLLGHSCCSQSGLDFAMFEPTIQVIIHVFQLPHLLSTT